MLCGDSHQIVHPNFFCWAALKSLFWQGLAGDAAQRQPLKLLQANFRNTRAVTELANTLLKIKQARFGSVDRESNFLVRSTSGEAARCGCPMPRTRRWRSSTRPRRSRRATRSSCCATKTRPAARAGLPHAAGLLGARGQGPGVPACPAVQAGVGPAPGLCRGVRGRDARPTCKATNSTTAAPATRPTSRWSCTSSTSMRCTWR